MTIATERWDAEAGYRVVTDECGNVWDVVTTGDRASLVERQDSDRYHGAVFVRGAGGGPGSIHPHDEGDEQGGYDCNASYRFSRSRGWEEVAADRN